MLQYLRQSTFNMLLYYQLGRTLERTFVPQINKNFKSKLIKVKDAIVFFYRKKQPKTCNVNHYKSYLAFNIKQLVLL